jgi:hypothetical protein
LTALTAAAPNAEPPRPIADGPETLGTKYRNVDAKPLDATHFVAITENVGRHANGQLAIVILDRSRPEASSRQLENQSESSLGQLPTLEIIDSHSAYVHFYSDYGFYERSLKYLFDLDTNKPLVKIRYGVLSLTSAAERDGELYYSASYSPTEPPPRGWHAEDITIVIQPRVDTWPEFQITNERIETIAVPGVGSARVENTTTPGRPHRPSTIFVGNQSYPAPIPTLHFYRQKLPEKQPPAEIESDIGPYVQRDEKIWFATTFYDGEGTSGIGAIGAFDINSRRYEMLQYLPEIVHWSASAILLDGNDLWIGLKQRPEGADIGKGLLRYNIQSGAVQTFPIPDVIFTLNFGGDALYCGTSHGLYMLRSDQLTQLRFEPDATGELTMIPRPIAK